MKTHITIPNNKPDIFIGDNEKEHACYVVVDDVISRDRNAVKKEAENTLNIKNLIYMQSNKIHKVFFND